MDAAESANNAVGTSSSKKKPSAVAAAAAPLTRSASASASAAAITASPPSSSCIWQRTMDVNYGGVVNVLQAALPGMVASGRGGRVIVTGSMGEFFFS